MTRKDYELIAAAINGVRTNALRNVNRARSESTEAALDAIDAVAYRLANDLARTNPRFDIDRFIQAATNV